MFNKGLKDLAQFLGVEDDLTLESHLKYDQQRLINEVKDYITIINDADEVDEVVDVDFSYAFDHTIRVVLRCTPKAYGWIPVADGISATRLSIEVAVNLDYTKVKIDNIYITNLRSK